MKRLCLLLCCLPMLCSCSFITLERQIYPICMSIDHTEDGKYLIGIQAPRASAGSGAASYEIITATGTTFDETLRTLSASTPYPLNFSQIRLCLIGYPLAAVTHLRALLRTVLELPTMRPNCYVSIAMGSAVEVMQRQQPDFGMRLSTHLSLMLDRMRTENLLPDSTLSVCVRDLSDGRSDPLIGVSAVNPHLLPEEEKAQQQPSGSPKPADETPAFALGEPWSDALLPEGISAGLVPHTSQNPVEYLGAAALSHGRVSGVLTADQVQLVLRLQKEARMKVAREGEKVQLQIWLKEGSALAQNVDAIYGLMEVLQALRSDPLLFGCMCSMGFGTDEEWMQYDFSGKYHAAQVVVRLTRIYE